MLHGDKVVLKWGSKSFYRMRSIWKILEGFNQKNYVMLSIIWYISSKREFFFFLEIRFTVFGTEPIMLENVYLSANWLSVSSNCIPFTSTFEKFSSALSDASQHRKDKKTTIVFKSSLTLFNPNRHLFLHPTMWNLSAVSGLRYPLWKVPLVVYFIVHARIKVKWTMESFKSNIYILPFNVPFEIL